MHQRVCNEKRRPNGSMIGRHATANATSRAAIVNSIKSLAPKPIGFWTGSNVLRRLASIISPPRISAWGALPEPKLALVPQESSMAAEFRYVDKALTSEASRPAPIARARGPDSKREASHSPPRQGRVQIRHSAYLYQPSCTPTRSKYASASTERRPVACLDIAPAAG